MEELDIDPNGRFAISRCHREGLNVNLVNVYDSNYDDPLFYLTLASRLFKEPALPQIWGGHFNCDLDPSLERSRGPFRNPSAAARAIVDIIEQLGLLDVWRMRSHNSEGFTHYSPCMISTPEFISG